MVTKNLCVHVHSTIQQSSNWKKIIYLDSWRKSRAYKGNSQRHREMCKVQPVLTPTAPLFNQTNDLDLLTNPVCYPLAV